jgi:hypothetical protein
VPEYEKAEHTLAFIHYTHDEGIGREVDEKDLTETETKRLRTWVEHMLRLEDAPAARKLYSILNKVVYEQAVEQGYSDAMEFGYSRLHSAAAGVWHDGYTQGFASGMTDRYEEAVPN